MVNSRKEPATLHLPFGGEDLLNGGHCEGEVTLEPLQVRLIRFF
ncbi:MAG: Beta-galactosidase C-terminal domain [Kiritimatiellae bacterium]|nr:Beta-galactosidase C-terminal domain [Kiritimatiellia bacterium]